MQRISALPTVENIRNKKDEYENIRHGFKD